MSEYSIFWITILLAICIFIKIKFIGMYRGKQRLDGKTVIVTGAASGIGRKCAQDFAKRGAKVIIVDCEIQKAEQVRSEIIENTGNKNMIKVKYVDLSSLESVRNCAKEILDEEERIDVLLNNAGAFNVGYNQTRDELDVLMQINHFGPFLFTNLLLDRIKKSAPSRIVNVASKAYRYEKMDPNKLKIPDFIKNPGFLDHLKLYSISKLCTVYFTLELARKLKGTGVTVNCLHPGIFPSTIYKNINPLLQSVGEIIVPIFYKSIEQAAQTSIYLCVSPDIEKVTGKYFKNFRIEELNEEAKSLEMAKKVWKISENAVKLH